ncbi:toxin-activating lysine-acyltransferase [Aliamphritea ceti]|uniref:toxin-activating lysine-acyltransferase n=1 Tax=Aliamphritea ceti TaxID=1524258 RepID=UPI0021C33789|nr:toxin-activating lysine-acyltransferase [Aliamphritea ceti]
MNQKQLLDLGRISWLWQNSELHKEWQVGAMSRYVLPAVASNQYLIIEHEGAPVAYCSWALFDEQAESDYVLDPASLSPQRWNCGERLWFIDWISPFNSRFTWMLRAELNNRFPGYLARAMRVKKTTDKARIASFSGKGLSREESHSLRRQYFTDMVEGVQNAQQSGADIKVNTVPG